MSIHPSAIVSKNAVIHPSVEVGPFSIIEENVVIGENSQLQARVTIHKDSTIGKNNFFASNSTIGGLPQDINFKLNSLSYTSIGDNNIFRENFTVNRSAKENGTTHIGSHCFFMCNTHVGHDCYIGNHGVFAPGVNVGGHASIGERVFISGSVQVHQFCKVGKLAMIGGLSPIIQDVIPYAIVFGNPAKILKVNRIGLERAGFDAAMIESISQAFRHFRNHLNLDDFETTNDETLFLKEWLKQESHKGIMRFKKLSKALSS